MHKFIEFNKPSLIFVDHIEQFFHIWNGDIQRLKHWNRQIELGLGDLLIMILVYLIKDCPVSVVISDVFDEIGKFCF